jgi:hypothetical protein
MNVDADALRAGIAYQQSAIIAVVALAGVAILIAGRTRRARSGRLRPDA